MGFKLLRLKVKDGHTHFASSRETVTLERDEDPPPDMKLERLIFLVSDAAGALVYREIWPGSKVTSEEEPQAKKNDSGGPPASFTWGGENNQIPPVLDEKKKPHPIWATPLGSPYEFKLVAELSKGKDLEKAPETMGTAKILPCEVGKESQVSKERAEEERPAPTLVSLQIACDGGTSKSFTLYDALAGRIPVQPESKERFHFAAGEEKNVKLTWKLSSEEEAKTTTGLLELFASGNTTALWSYPLDNAALKKKTLGREAWSGAKQGTDTFFDELLSFRGAPYKLRLTLDGPEIKKGFEIAWTYVDVKVESIDLLWGEAKKLPDDTAPTDAAAFKDLALKEEVLILARLKGAADADPDAKDLKGFQGDDDALGAKPVAADPLPLELRSNLFYQDITDWNNGKAATLYASAWGAGPRLPIVAEIKVRSASGDKVLAPKAVAGMQILWDWDDPCLEKEKGLETPGFLAWAFNAKAKAAARPDGRCDDDSPRSTNCHKDLGGKVGSGAAPVFPAQPGAGDEVKDGKFPFKVDACPFRKWAALSTVYAGADAKYQGKTGVVFQPARIAGDTYRVRAYLYTDQTDDFKHEIQGEDLWKAATEAGLARATTGAFEVWRRVDILRYYQKSGSEPAVDLEAINKKFSGGRIKLVLSPSNDAKAIQKMWGAGLTDILRAETVKGGANAQRANILAPEQVNNGYQLNTKTLSAWARAPIAWAIDELAKPTVYAGGTPPAVRVQKAKTAAATWWTVHDHLADGELDKLQEKLAVYIGANPKEALPDQRVSAVDNTTLIGALPMLYSGQALLGAWFKDGILGTLVAKYIKDPAALTSDAGAGNLKAKSGLHLFHFASPLPTYDDAKGSAFKLVPTLYGGAVEDAGKQGMLYFSAKPPENRVELHAHEKVDPLGGAGDNIIPGRLSVGFFPFYVSSDLAKDPTFKDDIDCTLATLVNAAAFKVLEKMSRESVVPPTKRKKDKEPADIAWERSLDLWQDYVHLGVKGGSKEAVDVYTKRLKELRKVDVSVRTLGTLDERNVFISRFDPLDEDRALRLRFGWRSHDLSHKEGDARLDAKILEWVRAAFRRTPVPIGAIHVFHRGNRDSKRRADAVAEHLGAILRIVEDKVKVNAGADIRPKANDHDSERDVYVSTAPTFDESTSTKLRFKSGSASVYKTKIHEALERFAGDAVGASKTVLPPIYVFYKDTKDGRRRRAVVGNYLSAFFEGKYKREDWALVPSYPLTPLAAHEMAHTLFLQHAPSLLPNNDPAGAEDWCHVKDYDCLMNYDPGGQDFCGFCLLVLRGWDVGTKAGSKLPGAPSHVGTTTPVVVTPKGPDGLPPIPIPTAPDHSVSHVLEDAGLALHEATDISGYRVLTLTVYAQGGAQGGLNTCGFHSIKNAMYLQHYVAKIQTTAGTYRKGQLADKLLDLVQTVPGADARFTEVFLDGGDETTPGPKSWLKAARDKGNMPQGADRSIDAEHQREIVAKLLADTCRLPTDGGGTIPAAAAGGIAVNLDFGEAGEFVLLGGDEVPHAIKRLYELHGAPPVTRSFTCGVGRHFIAITANRYEADAVELIVADSLNGSTYANERAIRGIAAWIDDADHDLAEATFKTAFFDDLSRRLPRLHDDLKQPDVGALDLLQITDFLRIFENAASWLVTAGLVTDPKLVPYALIMKGYLAAFPGRLDVIGGVVDPIKLRCTTAALLLT